MSKQCQYSNCFAMFAQCINVIVIKSCGSYVTTQACPIYPPEVDVWQPTHHVEKV